MSRPSYTKALNDVLEPEGFRRSGREWTRIRGDRWEWVDLQTSQFAGTTANIAMKDLETERIILEVLPSFKILPPIVYRIGSLMDGYDHWWTIESNGPAEVAAAVKTYGLPEFDRIKTLEDQASKWFGRGSSGRWWHAPSAICLAITLHRLGEDEEACQALKGAPKSTPQVWLEDVQRLRRWLGCPDV